MNELFLRNINDSRDLFYYKISKATITGTSDKTDFYIPILETGWIYNVWLVINGIYTIYVEEPYMRAVDYNNSENIYSIFHAKYQFKKARDNVEVHWCYTIDGKQYVSPSIHFDVMDY